MARALGCGPRGCAFESRQPPKMVEKVEAIDWFKQAGINVTETPSRFVASCLIGRRPPVSFNPGSPESVENARKAARKHFIPRGCGDHCSLPCTLRRLDSETDNRLLGIFGLGGFT